jgi:hypothetical protein
MPNISEAEARVLLGRPLRCEGDFAWTSQKDKPPGRIISVGIVDEAGKNTDMVVELKYSHSVAKTKYVFSVILLSRFSTERVYQLEVNQGSAAIKSAHAISHEHIGDRRVVGAAAWRHWSYDEVLARFCAQTNITFTPLPPCP